MRFSVIIATLNRRDYALAAVESVVRQTHAAHEIIVVVDGSTDDTAAAIRRTYPGVIVVEQPNLGRAVARNTGVAHATGDWVCFLDDDDLWHADLLAETVSYVNAHPDCLALRAPIWFFSDAPDGPGGGFGFQRDFVARDLDECHLAAASADPDRNPSHYLNICGNSYKLLLERCRGVMSTTCVHRATLIRAGAFPAAQSYSEDWMMFLNVARLTEWHLIPRKLGFMRLHQAQSGAVEGNLALMMITSYVAAWHLGRPLPHRAGIAETRAAMAACSRAYRSAIQQTFWNALRRGQLRVAMTAQQLGSTVLVRLRDRLYVLIPPPITWRWERYVLGMHQ